MATHPFRQAWESGDPAILIGALAPDAVLHSPIVSEPFRGRDAIAALYDVLFDVVHELEFTDELQSESAYALFWRAEVGGKRVEGVDLLQQDAAGAITEITVMARPLAGAAGFAAAAGPPLAARHGRANRALMAALAKPLPGLLALGDRAGARLAKLRG